MKTLRLGTRKSALAQAQAKWVAEHLRASFPELDVAIVGITTTGDNFTSPGQPPSPLGRPGLPQSPRAPQSRIDAGGTSAAQREAKNKGGLKALFTKEIEEALLEKRIDLAVHSLKDMAADLPKGLVIGAVPEREDPRDAWISKNKCTFGKLAKGSKVGTGAVRRQAQLHHARPDLEIVPIRGNVDSRLRKLAENELDGIILALAGLKRLGRAKEVTEIMPPDILLPAVGQGCLAIEVRQADREVSPYIKALDHAGSHQAALAERAYLKALGGSCQTPIAGHAIMEGAHLVMSGMVLSQDGRQMIKASENGRAFDAEGIGTRLAEKLLAAGADKILSL